MSNATPCRPLLAAFVGLTVLLSASSVQGQEAVRRGGLENELREAKDLQARLTNLLGTPNRPRWDVVEHRKGFLSRGTWHYREPVAAALNKIIRDLEKPENSNPGSPSTYLWIVKEPDINETPECVADQLKSLKVDGAENDQQGMIMQGIHIRLTRVFEIIGRLRDILQRRLDAMGPRAQASPAAQRPETTTERPRLLGVP